MKEIDEKNKKKIIKKEACSPSNEIDIKLYYMADLISQDLCCDNPTPARPTTAQQGGN